MENDYKMVNVHQIIDQVANGELSPYDARGMIPYTEFAKPKIRKLFDAATEQGTRINEHKRDLLAIYICGSSGGGKTSFAEYFCRKRGISYYKSDCGEHSFDNYEGQTAIILDDYRGEQTVKDFIKVIDNHFACRAPARYKNKDMSFCRFVLITSIKTPRQLYPNVFSDDNSMIHLNNNEENSEPYEQLVRRLDNRQYLCVDPENDIYKVMNADNDSYEEKCYMEKDVDSEEWFLLRPSMVINTLKKENPTKQQSILGSIPETCPEFDEINNQKIKRNKNIPASYSNEQIKKVLGIIKSDKK